MVSAIFMSLMYTSNFTGLATGQPPQTNNQQKTELPKPSQQCIDPNANQKCGSSCWLDTDGFPPSTFEQSKGKVGVIDWNERCRDITNSINPDATLCCSSCDCPQDYTCIIGTCKLSS